MKKKLAKHKGDRFGFGIKPLTKKQFLKIKSLDLILVHWLDAKPSWYVVIEEVDRGQELKAIPLVKHKIAHRDAPVSCYIEREQISEIKQLCLNAS